MTTSSPGSARRGLDTRESVLAALFTALLGASAWISIHLGAVPVTLQVFVVLLAGLLLRPRAAAAALAAYLLLGAVGVPVFAGGLGGLGVLAGPTGGYLLGFAIAAPFVSATAALLARRFPPAVAEVLACSAGIAVIYTLGWLQLSLVTGMGASQAFVAGVAPFIVLDAVKGVAAATVAAVLRRSGVVAFATR